ncbi:hypothetical protein [Mycolicibacterium moriokaense]|uniref:hypothetical protein n=1 Tax=Mycolicibacterium moriokaense TaxID=39691 RepID=UPI0011B7D196|nr:hypothetical protein [Mycolicibacterium moriokaense]
MISNVRIDLIQWHGVFPAEGLNWVFAAIAALTMSVRYAFREKSYGGDLRNEQQFDRARISEYWRRADYMLPEELARALVFLRSPETYTTKIAETVKLDGTSMVTTVSMRLSLARLVSGETTEHEDTGSDDVDEPREVFILGMVQKGQDLQNLSISVDAKRVSAIPYRDANALTIRVLGIWIQTILDDALSTDMLATWKDLLVHVCSDVIPSDADIAAIEAETKRFGEQLSAKALRGGGRSDAVVDAEIDRLITTVGDLYRRRPVWCRTSVVTTSRRYYRVDATYDRPISGDSLRGGSGVRLGLGLIPRELKLSPDYATRCQSYELEVVASDGLYFHSGQVDLDQAPQHRRDRRGSAAMPNHSVELLGHGTSVAHLRIRDISASSAANGPTPPRFTPSLGVQFREVPPGSLGIIVGLSFYVGLLSWLVGYNYSAITVAAQSPQSFSQAWITLLMTVPTIVSAWAVAKFTVSLPRASASTVLLMVWAFVNATALIALSALAAVGRGTMEHIGPHGSKVASVTWLILLLSSAMHMLCLFGALLTDTLQYRLRVKSGGEIYPATMSELARSQFRLVGDRVLIDRDLRALWNQVRRRGSPENQRVGQP